MKLTSPTKTLAKTSLMALPLLLAAPAANAFVISFTGANHNVATATSSAPSAMVTTTTPVIPGTFGTTSTASISYTTTGDLDGDGTGGDSLTVTFALTANNSKNPTRGTNNVANQSGFGTRDSTSTNPLGELVGSANDSITFTYSSATGTFSSGQGVPTLKPFDFTSVSGAGNGAFVSTPPTVTSVAGTFAGTPDTAFTMTGNAGRGGVATIGFDVQVVTVPEPSSAMLLGSVGLLGLLCRRR